MWASPDLTWNRAPSAFARSMENTTELRENIGTRLTLRASRALTRDCMSHAASTFPGKGSGRR